LNHRAKTTTPIPLPDEFKSRIAGAFVNGQAWLELLPALLAEAQARWQIAVGPPFDLSFNYVAPGITADGRAIVLKLGVPNPELTAEIQALRLYAGHGAVRLLDADDDKGILLMDRINPGTSLTSVLNDEQATRIAARTMRGLWQPPAQGHAFPSVESWASGLKRLRKRFDGGPGPFPAQLVDLAEHLFTDLLSSATRSVLLHGDLHHLNILLSHEEWIAIDPKGVVGEPEYEAAALLENPAPELYTDIHVQRRRLDVLADELNLDWNKLLAYGIAHTMLSAWWSYEDGQDEWESACACAGTLASLLKR
jgi:streptomycin 6-kinase